MPNVIKVDTNDKFRVLLTDVLPYELPLWFSNFNLYQRFRNKKHLQTYETISGLKFDNNANKYIPLDYDISRGSNSSPRILSIMHPGAQLKVCDFYHEYDHLIEYYCTKSKHSLRYAARVSTKFYGKSQEGSKLSDGVEELNEERIVSSSYFKYRGHSFLYRFFDSYDYHKLEKQFPSMLQVDISKCFASIYTHSIGWAVKNKKLSKLNPLGSFDGKFDALMQLTNYKETHGIIIGPEVSRIFAEIILQKIDLNLIDKMSGKYKVSKDYNFRRYVDDYFVFYRSEEVRIAFVKSLELCLIEYKMYLNDAKTTIVSRPFSTDISLAKYSLQQAVSECFTSRFKGGQIDIENIDTSIRPASRANKTISEIKMALAHHKVKYASISNYLFTSIVNNMDSYLDMISDVEPKKEYHLNWLLVDLDVIFFVHAMDIRISPTDRLARVINDVLYKLGNWPSTYKALVHKKIFDHIKLAISILKNNADKVIGLETLNLLIILTMLPENYLLKENKLQEYFGLSDKSSGTNDFYFHWITSMLYIRDREEYNSSRNSLLEKAKDYLLNNENMFIDSEYFMFYFDYLACPYIDENVRKKIMEEVRKKTFLEPNKEKPVNFNIEKQSETVLSKDFIVSWRDPDYLKSCLEKKKYIFPYN